MTPTCARCKRPIPSDDINVARDVAYCRPCNSSYRLSALTREGELDDKVDLANPPRGTWCHRDGAETVIGASHRALGMALGVLVMSLFWNGIVSIFVLMAGSATLSHLHIRTPAWYPLPPMDAGSLSASMTIFLWVLLTPFILIGMALIGSFLLCLWGRTEVSVQNTRGLVFTGVGALGRRRRFDGTAIKRVWIQENLWSDRAGNNRLKSVIMMETTEGKLIKFGSQLAEEKRKFLASATKRALAV